jgi:hypothetical protein
MALCSNPTSFFMEKWLQSCLEISTSNKTRTHDFMRVSRRVCDLRVTKFHDLGVWRRICNFRVLRRIHNLWFWRRIFHDLWVSRRFHDLWAFCLIFASNVLLQMRSMYLQHSFCDHGWLSVCIMCLHINILWDLHFHMHLS